jgi:hypothetical protein
MRFFWILLIVLAIGGTVYLLSARGQGSQPPAPAPTSDSAAAADVALTTPEPTTTTIPAPTLTPQPETKPEATTESKPEPTPEATTEPAPTATPPTSVPEVKSDDLSAYEVVPAAIVKNEDGSMRIDNRFTVKGDGSAEKPFEVSWEHLISAEELFSPENKKKKLPERITMLHDKWVKIDGNIAFPLMVKQPRELLAMLNQWDGCCIGVPPTPYDAIEVQLKKTVSEEARFATVGSVTGKFLVKPYLVGDWLVGLYVMEQGDLSVKEYGGAGGS